MKVLMIAPEPIVEPRGTPISVAQRLRGLSALEHQVDLVTYHIGENLELPGVTTYRIPAIPFLNHVRVGPSWAKCLLDILVFIRALCLLLIKRYDVVHSHEEAAFFALFLAKLFRVRHLYDMHSILSRQLANSKYRRYKFAIRLFAILETWVMRNSDAVIAVSAELASYVNGVNPDVPVAVIENLPVQSAIEPDTPIVDELRRKLGIGGRTVILYTGTFESYQGLDLLIESIKIVCARHPETVLVAVGGQPHQIDRLQEAIAAENLQKYVQFVGSISVSSIVNYFAIADILVSPRIGGPTVPLKIYSYLHAGKPIVATAIPAHLQVLSEECARLVAPEAEAFACGILEMIDFPEQAATIARKAKEYATARFRFGDYAAKVQAIYAAMLRSGPAGEVKEKDEEQKSKADMAPLVDMYGSSDRYIRR